jgi:hypothetical protein
MFVDDPRSSVELAAGLAGDSVEPVVSSVKEQRHSLLSAWQGDDRGTGELRTAHETPAVPRILEPPGGFLP